MTAAVIADLDQTIIRCLGRSIDGPEVDAAIDALIDRHSANALLKALIIARAEMVAGQRFKGTEKA